MEKTKIAWGELIIPGLAVTYCIYAVISQNFAELDRKTVLYSVFLTIPVFICSGIALIGVIKNPKEAKSEEEHKLDSRAQKNVLKFLIWAILFVVSIHTLGYFIGIFVYLGVFLWMMGERPWYKVLIIDIIMVLMVHFVFVRSIGLPLPKGILNGIL